MNRRHILSWATLSVAGAAAFCASAQEVPRVGRDGYREGVPGVIKPPAPPPPPRLTPFEAAYRAAGRPRLVLFFNREIADVARAAPVVQRRDTATLTDEVSASVSRAPKVESAGDSASGNGRQSLRAETTTEITVRRDAVGARQAPTDEAQQWQFENAFTERLAAERIQMVDRATAIRIAGMTQVADPQRLETGAIRSYADVAVVVRATPMADGSLLHRVTGIDTRNGRVVADVLVPASDAGQGGPSAIGRLAGEKLVQRLVAEWKPAR